MKYTITFETTDREERGIAFAVAHPGDGPTDADAIMVNVLRERFEVDAKQQDAADTQENHEAYVAYELREPAKAQFMANVIKAVAADPAFEAAIIPEVLAIAQKLGVEMPK